MLMPDDIERAAAARDSSMRLRAQTLSVLAASAGRVLAFEDGLPTLRAAA